MSNASDKRSLYVTLGVIVVFTVMVSMSFYSAYQYVQTRDKMIEEMKKSSDVTVSSLQKNIANLIEAYAINEYDTMLLNEMEPSDAFAIIVDDFNMGKIVGLNSYTSGKVHEADGQIVDFDPKNPEHLQSLVTCYYSKKYPIISDTGVQIGAISIYISDTTMNNELHDIIIKAIIDTLLISLLMIFALFTVMRIFVFKPLSQIVGLIENSDEDGIPKELIPDYDAKEISILSSTMNRMIFSIRTSKIALLEQHNQLKHQKNELLYQATHDALTDLANRVLFTERLANAITDSQAMQIPLALLFIDLDHFKEINDSFGHEAGDQVLQIVTQRLRHIIPDDENIARFGGDEFTVIIKGYEHVHEISDVASAILDLLSEAIIVEHNEFYVGCSIGVSLFPENGNTPQDLFKYADAAMYAAKSEGRNNIRYYTSDMTAKALERVTMEAGLRLGLKNSEFIVYYQPQVNGRDNRLIGMEALIRWQSPTAGLISPAVFIPIAEATGLIVELDRFVMREAMNQIAKWYRQGYVPGILAMNLTMKQIEQNDFIDFLHSLIHDTGCRVEWIELEVTEDQIMINPEKSIEILRKISAIGIKIAVDDFGTGYSSLAYLKKLPINKLKIDQSFIRDLPDNEEDVAISKAIVALGQSLNLEIIAEGVETMEQKEFLVQNGCENIQGYFYSKPLPANEIELILSNGFVKK